MLIFVANHNNEISTIYNYTVCV